MRTFTLLSMALVASSSTRGVLAHSFESFDSSNMMLNARGVMPATVPMSGLVARSERRSEMVKMNKRKEVAFTGAASAAAAVNVQKRGEENPQEGDDEEDCEEEEEDDDEGEECDAEDDDEEDCEEDDTPEAAPAPQLPTKEHFVQPTIPEEAPEVEEKPAVVEKPKAEEKPKKSEDKPKTKPTDLKAIQAPSNLAKDSWQPAEGCIRYHTVTAGEVCLGVLDGSRDLHLTLDQFYCLNPSINDDCSNLYEGVAYCTGYGGEWPNKA